MNSVALWAVACTMVLSGGDAGKKDTAALQGTWKVTASTSKGEKVPAKDLDLLLSIKGDSITVREGGKTVMNFTYSVDPTKKVKEIDLTLGVGPQKGRIDRGIYEIDGDTLRICIQSNKDAPRPTEFVSRTDSEVWLVILQRTKD